MLFEFSYFGSWIEEVTGKNIDSTHPYYAGLDLWFLSKTGKEHGRELILVSF